MSHVRQVALVRRARGLGALGAVCAQVTAALGSLVLQVLAARSLGASGLGTFAFLYGAVIMATAVSGGLIGDSLTVLDRRRPDVRAALWRLGWLTAGAAALLAFLSSLFQLGPIGAVWFAGALAAFVVEDLGRRLLMAALRFWHLLVVDGLALVVSLVVLGVWSLAAPLGVEAFLAGLAIGQAAAALAAFLLLPRREKQSVPRAWGAWREVIAYGSWRAAQQLLRPTMLNAARGVVLVAAGTAAVGELEVARIFVAPAMVLVQGLGSYLFSTYAADKEVSTELLRDRADRTAVAMLVGSVVIAGTASALLPYASGLLTAGSFGLSQVAVLGWACYAASVAAVLPYGSLAAVRGRQRALLVVRVLDSLLSLALAAVAIWGFDVDAQWLPWLLSVGSFAGGWVCRQILLKPVLPSSRRSP